MSMDAKEIRVANLRRLVRDKAEDNQRKFADMMEWKQPAYVSQLLTGHRDIGDKTARKIERQFHLRHGELDHMPGGLTPEAEQVGRDWLLLAEPLRSQWREGLRAAANQARRMGPPALDTKVARTIAPSPEAIEREAKKQARKGGKS